MARRTFTESDISLEIEAAGSTSELTELEDQFYEDFHHTEMRRFRAKHSDQESKPKRARRTH